LIVVAGPPVKPSLLDPCAATLDQNNQDDDNQNTGYNPDDHCTVHENSSLSYSKILTEPPALVRIIDAERLYG
jgi:hypothetical protein